LVITLVVVVVVVVVVGKGESMIKWKEICSEATVYLRLTD
jgi:hypothetical protein